MVAAAEMLLMEEMVLMTFISRSVMDGDLRRNQLMVAVLE